MPPLSTPTQTPLAPKPTKPPPPHPPLPPPPAAAAAAAAMAEEELPLRPSKHQLLRHRRRTNPLVWCFAILCFLFSLLLIFAGILILVVFLLIKPRNPQFHASAASLNGIYIDSPPTVAPSAPGYYYLNGDLTLLANISNPNPHIDVAFRYLSVELYFRDRLIAAQGLAPFAQRRGEARVASLHMVTSEVGLPRELAAAMAEEVRRGRVSYIVRGTFKVRASLGFGHLTYWVYGRCDIDLSPPPSGVLLASSCSTKHSF
ncbi:hypothetical protein ACMD2_15422 [Ananas comosus]|uniref:Late embryogenesis abundant protein LEA-2 subgroup domain-containing protein n=1 Tax=Ananas comosus TaxID=4615 RepID=A0A199UEF7_ANACO|nr:hypothetical protein ACMD2_15422 [Ananas comosus]